MHIFLDNFHQDEKYSAQIASHQAELRREENFTDQKSLSILSIHTNYLNIDRSSGCGRNSKGANIIHKSAPFVDVRTIIQKNVSKGSERKAKSSCGW